MKRSFFSAVFCLVAVCLTVGGAFASGVNSRFCKSVSPQAVAEAIGMPEQMVREQGVRIASRRFLNASETGSGTGMCELILTGHNLGPIPVYLLSEHTALVGMLYVNDSNVTREKLMPIVHSYEQESAGRHAEAAHKHLKELNNLTVFSYIPKGHIRGTLFMFTDPVCPFCHRAESHIKKLADEYHVRVNFIFAPVHFPDGDIEAQYVICKKMDAETYLSGTWKKGKSMADFKAGMCAEGHDKVEKGKSLLFKDIGANGVPSFYYWNGKGNGAFVVGANLMKIEEFLK